MHSNRRERGTTMRRYLSLTTIITLLFSLFATSAPAAERIALFVSSDEGPYKEAVGGFHESMAKQGLKPAYELLNLGGDASRAAAAVQKLKMGKFDLIFAL